MATCELCKREMLKAKGCAVETVHINGKKYKRIPVGAQGDFFADMPPDGRCGDCNALFGHYHHWGCDCERCPVCSGQLISCDCEDAYAEGRE